MAGLFETPGDVRAAQEQQVRTLSPQQQLQGSLFNLGNVGGKAIARGGFGVDTRSPAELRAMKLQELARGIDFRDQNSIRQGMQALNQAGFQDEAFKLDSLLDAPTTPRKPDDNYVMLRNPNAGKGANPEIFTETIDSPDGTGSKTVSFFKRFNRANNKIEKIPVGEQANVAPPTDRGDKDPIRAIYGKVSLDAPEQLSMLGQFAGMPQFKAFFGDTDEADIEKLPGLVKNVADQRKASALSVAQRWQSGGQPTIEEARTLFGDVSEDQLGREFQAFQADPIGSMNRIFGTLGDQRWMREGLSTFIAGGGFNKSIDEELTGGAKVDLNATVDPTNLAALEKTQKFNAELADAIDKTGVTPDGGITGFVAGDADTGFVLQQFTPEKLRTAFENMPADNAGMQQRLEQKFGVKFGPRSLESHARVWDYMRDAPPGLVSGYMKALMLPEEGKRYAAAKIQELTEGNNPYGVANAGLIFAYMNRIGESEVAKSERLRTPAPGSPRESMGIQ
jgi:hypothetical protein